MEVMGNKDANYFHSTRELIEFGATIEVLPKHVQEVIRDKFGTF